MDIYQEEILEHYHHPRCQEKIKKPTHSACSNNPTCGDKLCFELKIEKNKIEIVYFTGEGCAISQAAASMLSAKVQNQTITQIQKIKKDDIIEMLGIKLSPTRLKCALLSLETLQKTLANQIK